MDPLSIAVLGSVAVVAVYFAMVYNNLVQVKHNVAKAWANIDVLLKQRHDELPKMIETCRQYMKFEQDTLARVMEARSQVAAARESRNMPALGAAEQGLRSTVGQLFAVAEAYPELKTDQTFLQLQSRIVSLENAIADRREFYNESANINNVRIEQFPDVVVASLFAFKPAPLLHVVEGDKADVDVRRAFSA
ncbi:MAG TPA: LemA family protein [Burkholderiales bacterium]|nr:LemA family protein [Burkholderiales bacterium]